MVIAAGLSISCLCICMFYTEFAYLSEELILIYLVTLSRKLILLTLGG